MKEEGFVSLGGLIAALVLIWLIGGYAYGVRNHYEEETRLRLAAESAMEDFCQELRQSETKRQALPGVGEEKDFSYGARDGITVIVFVKGGEEGFLLAARASLRRREGVPKSDEKMPSFYRYRCFLPERGGELIWPYQRL